MKKWLSLAFVVAAACGGKAKSSTTTVGEGSGSGSASGSGTGEVVGPPTVAWKDMSLEQHEAFMKAKVLPTMKPLFAAAAPDDKDLQNIDCETCHGDGAKDGSFEMPNPKLPVLPNDPDGFKKVVNDHPQMSEFMMKTVKPTMAKLLGLDEMDQAHPDGFSCHSCHPGS